MQHHHLYEKRVSGILRRAVKCTRNIFAEPANWEIETQHKRFRDYPGVDFKYSSSTNGCFILCYIPYVWNTCCLILLNG